MFRYTVYDYVSCIVDEYESELDPDAFFENFLNTDYCLRCAFDDRYREARLIPTTDYVFDILLEHQLQ